MSVPSLPSPRPQGSAGAKGRAVPFVLLGVCTVAVLWCGGICAGGAFFFVTTARVAKRAQSTNKKQFPVPLIPFRWTDNRVVMAYLGRAYTAALDAAAADKNVIERLGEPIEVGNNPDGLFRRERTGPFTSEDETIEFEIHGPKGDAVVRVVATGAIGPPGGRTVSLVKKITVKFSDGSESKVPSPNVPDNR